MQISIGVPPGPQSRALAVRAEELGYDRIWFYDSASLFEDVWIHLAQVAEATQRIGIGTGVLVPNLRHVMTTASAIATIERLAPGRLACAVGTGYTARVVLGQRALPWKVVREYVERLRALLRGEIVEIEGRPCQMIHRPEYATPRPIEIPFLLSAFGPKGMAITREIADGWMGVSPPPESPAPFEWAVQMVNGTVLASGESASSARVVDAVGPWQVGAYHLTWEAAPENLPAIPGGAEWLAQIESEHDEAARHLAVHYSHCTHLSAADRKALAVFGDQIPWHGWVGEKGAVRERAEAAKAAGTTEILYTPAGDDLLGQVETFYDAVQSVRD